MPAKYIPVSKIKTNRKNPRSIDPAKFEDLKQSIIDFPEMMNIRPIIVDEKWEVLAGRQRFAACVANGMEKLPAKWVLKYDSLSEEQKQKFLVKDNVHSGDWGWEVFEEEEWKEAPIDDWVDMPIAKKEKEPKNSLLDPSMLDGEVSISFKLSQDQYSLLIAKLEKQKCDSKDAAFIKIMKL